LNEGDSLKFDNRVLSTIFGSKREEVTGGWRKFNNKELHNLLDLFLLNIIRVIQSRGMR
jgi:hypothetical protein